MQPVGKLENPWGAGPKQPCCMTELHALTFMRGLHLSICGTWDDKSRRRPSPRVGCEKRAAQMRVLQADASMLRTCCTANVERPDDAPPLSTSSASQTPLARTSQASSLDAKTGPAGGVPWAVRALSQTETSITTIGPEDDRNLGKFRQVFRRPRQTDVERGSGLRGTRTTCGTAET